MENIKGRVVSVKEWESGKGSFVKIDGDERDFYKFGRNGVAVGLVIEAKVKPGTGAFSDKVNISEIVSAVKTATTEPKKEFPVDSMNGIDAKAKYTKEEDAKHAFLVKPMTKEIEEQYTKEWRALARNVGAECFQDAQAMIGEDNKHEALLFASKIFEKRMKPLHYYIEERRLGGV